MTGWQRRSLVNLGRWKTTKFHLSDTLPGGQVSILAVMEAPIGFGDEDGEELQRSLPTVEGMHSYRIK